MTNTDDLQDFLEEWFEVAQEVGLNPSEFFRNETRRNGLEYPIRFAITSLVISGLLTAGLTGSISSIVSTVISGLVGLFLASGMVHVFASFLGAENSFNETLGAFSYSSIIHPIATVGYFIPTVGPAISAAATIYGFFLHIKGVSEFQSMTTGRAAAAVLLPALILAAITAVLLLTVFAGVSMALAALA